MRGSTAGRRHHSVRRRDAFNVGRRGFVPDQNDFLAGSGDAPCRGRIQRDRAARHANPRQLGFRQRPIRFRIEMGATDAVQIDTGEACQRGGWLAESLLDHIDSDSHRSPGRAFGIAGLQEPEDAGLDGEFEVLRVAEQNFQFMT